MPETTFSPVSARSSLETWQCDPTPPSRTWRWLAEFTGFVTVTAFIVGVFWIA